MKEGLTSSRQVSVGGSVSNEINAKVSANVHSVFTAELGFSHTTGYNWAEARMRSFSTERTHKVDVPCAPGTQYVSLVDLNRNIKNHN